jgi:acyl carrier protein
VRLVVRARQSASVAVIVSASRHGAQGGGDRSHKIAPMTRPMGAGATMTANKELLHEVATLLIDALNLETAPEAIDPQAPLYGDGLGLDSIDMLEVSLVVSQRYGVQLRSDDENNDKIFASLANLADHIAAHRTT